jgi:hypothetical protein
MICLCSSLCLRNLPLLPRTLLCWGFTGSKIGRIQWNPKISLANKIQLEVTEPCGSKDFRVKGRRVRKGSPVISVVLGIKKALIKAIERYWNRKIRTMRQIRGIGRIQWIQGSKLMPTFTRAQSQDTCTITKEIKKAFHLKNDVIRAVSICHINHGNPAIFILGINHVIRAVSIVVNWAIGMGTVLLKSLFLPPSSMILVPKIIVTYHALKPFEGTMRIHTNPWHRPLLSFGSSFHGDPCPYPPKCGAYWLRAGSYGYAS